MTEDPDPARTTYEPRRDQPVSATTYEAHSGPVTTDGPGVGGSLPTVHEPVLQGSAAPGGVSDQRTRLVVLPPKLTERYDYLGDISRIGAQAEVVHCRDKQTGEEVAIKIYRSLTEIEVAESLGRASRDHVVPMTIDADEERTWEIQEYFRLGSLEDLVCRHGLPLPEMLVRRILIELTDAIDHVHALDVQHRDIKPGNVLVRTENPDLDLVLADFGFARFVHGGIGSVAGTYPYMSPEGFHGNGKKPMDWWALGVMIHEFLGGRHLFAAPNGRGLLPEQEIRAYAIERQFTIDNITDARWHLLISGLLTHDVEHRWAAPQVREWLAGGSPAVRSSQRRAASGQIFDFDGVRYTKPVALADAFASHPTVAYNLLSDAHRVRDLTAWLRQTDVGGAADDLLRDLRDGADPRRSMVELLLIMAPDMQPSFEGLRLDGEELTAISQGAIRGDREAAAWIRSLRDLGILSAVARHLEDGTRWSHAEELMQGWARRIEARLPALRSDEELRAGVDSILIIVDGQLLAAALDPAEQKRLDRAATEVLAQIPPDYPQPVVRIATDSSDLGERLVAAGLCPMVRTARDEAERARRKGEREERRLQRRAERERASAQRRQRLLQAVRSAWSYAGARLAWSGGALVVGMVIWAVAVVSQGGEFWAGLVPIATPLLAGTAIAFVADMLMPRRAGSALSYAIAVTALFFWLVDRFDWAVASSSPEAFAAALVGLYGWAPVFAIGYAGGSAIGFGLQAIPVPRPAVRQVANFWVTVLPRLSIVVATAAYLFTHTIPWSEAWSSAPEFIRSAAATVQFDLGGLTPLASPGSAMAWFAAVVSMVLISGGDVFGRFPRAVQWPAWIGMNVVAALVVASGLGVVVVGLWALALVLIPLILVLVFVGQ